MSKPTVIDPLEMRAHPELLRELREQPGKYAERRVVGLRSVESRANEDGSFRFGGLAAVFDEMSQNLGGFREVIKRGAFKPALKDNPDVRALFNHDPNRILARTANGTLRIKETPKGLDYEGDAAPTTYANDLRLLLERGDVNQSSFAFRIAPGGDSWDEDPETGALIRTIHEISNLYDVSPVTDPAYTQTTSGLRFRPEVQQLLDGADSLDDEERAAIVAALDHRSSKQQSVPAEAEELGAQGEDGDGPEMVMARAAARQRALKAWELRLRADA